MTKILLSYLAGTLTIGIAVYVSAGNSFLIAFALGAFTVLTAAAVALGSVKRIRSATRFLTAFASGLESRGSHQVETPAVVAIQSTVERDVRSALINMGTSHKIAQTAAQTAAAELPGAFFEDTFRLALKYAGRKAA